MFLNTDCLFFHSSCKKTFEEFDSYLWDEEKQDESVIKANDHCMDMVRYFCRKVLRRELL